MASCTLGETTYLCSKMSVKDIYILQKNQLPGKLFRICLYCFMLCMSSALQAKVSERDSVRFTLLTCSPGTQVYELFGHTAIRYQNFSKEIDWVYNYGVFDFDAPHFVWRFVLGETDYMLDVVSYGFFQWVYSSRGSEVYEQQLNLTDQEAFALFSALQQNAMPKERIYRYNYFFDNCTTRARDRIEEALHGRITYTENSDSLTFREWIHRCTQGHPWTTFGIDLCLGSEADIPIDFRQQMFLPVNLMKAFRSASLSSDSKINISPLVQSESILIPGKTLPFDSPFPLSPMQSSLLILVLTLLLIAIEYRIKKVFWGWDLFLFALQGIAGCVISLLFFFSVHPTVGTNYLVILLNPLPLIYLPFMIYHIKKGRKDLYDVANIAVLTLFISFLWLIPQKIDLVIVPLALSLLLRSIMHLYIAHSKTLKFTKK